MFFINPMKNSECMHKHKTKCRKKNQKNQPGKWEALDICVGGKQLSSNSVKLLIPF